MMKELSSTSNLRAIKKRAISLDQNNCIVISKIQLTSCLASWPWPSHWSQWQILVSDRDQWNFCSYQLDKVSISIHNFIIRKQTSTDYFTLNFLADNTLGYLNTAKDENSQSIATNPDSHPMDSTTNSQVVCWTPVIHMINKLAADTTIKIQSEVQSHAKIGVIIHLSSFIESAWLLYL